MGDDRISNECDDRIRTEWSGGAFACAQHSPERYETWSPERADIEHRFTYHAPSPEQVVLYNELRRKYRQLALNILELCPRSRERSLAFTHLEESLMQANASIARQR